MPPRIFTAFDVGQIISAGFDYVIPQSTIDIIETLATKVGASSYVKTPVFKKMDVATAATAATAATTSTAATSSVFSTPMSGPGSSRDTNFDETDGFETHHGRRCKKNRSGGRSHNSEYGATGATGATGSRGGNDRHSSKNTSEWARVPKFKTTKIVEKSGIDLRIDRIRTHLNKLSDKNYLAIKQKIVEEIDIIIDAVDPGDDDNSSDNISMVGIHIFEVASNNRFYSKIYADLYCSLISDYSVFSTIFMESFTGFIDMFGTIECGDPLADYDKFCDANTVNEKRRALSVFFVNLMNNGILTEPQVLGVIHILLMQVNDMVMVEDRKNEIDEIIENVVLIYADGWIAKSPHSGECDYSIDVGSDKMSIVEFVTMLATSKPKMYKSMTNKSIFKLMDMLGL